MNQHHVVWGCVFASLVGGAGCALDVGSTSDDRSASSESVGEAKSALTTVNCGANYFACYDQLDATGSVWVRYYMCKVSSPAHSNAAGCPVEADRVLVGGGAYVEGGNGNGAILTATFPSGKAGGAWIAVSQEAGGYSDLHQLRTWAVGLKLSAFSVTQLDAAVHVTQTSSAGNVSKPTIEAVIPSDDTVLLGGGALTSPGQFLTGVFPTGHGWAGKSKDHIIASPGSITVVAYSMLSQPFGLDYKVGSIMTVKNTVVPSGWWSSESDPVAAGSAVIAAGGDAFYNGAGRLLTMVFPNPGHQTTQMASKDHGIVDTGTNKVTSLSLRRL